MSKRETDWFWILNRRYIIALLIINTITDYDFLCFALVVPLMISKHICTIFNMFHTFSNAILHVDKRACCVCLMWARTKQLLNVLYFVGCDYYANLYPYFKWFFFKKWWWGAKHSKKNTFSTSSSFQKKYAIGHSVWLLQPRISKRKSCKNENTY